MAVNRKKIIFTVFILFIIFLVVGYFFILSKQEQSEVIDETRDLFPFGQIETGIGGGKNDSQGTIGGDNGNQETGEEGEKEPPKIKAGPRLRQITDFPTGGFGAVIKEEEKEISDISINAEGVSTQTTQTIEVENNYIRYSSIADASIYETKLTPSSLTQDKLVSNFIPNAEHAYFNRDGSKAIFQYWNNDERLAETYLANIDKINLEIGECPYDFSKDIFVGAEGDFVFGIHSFLNKNPRTKISVSGINSPGNETSTASEATITAIKNFQSLHELDIDGKLGSATQEKMKEICDLEQKQIAEKKFSELKEKYEISGFFLPQNIASISINPKGDKLFYIQEDKVGVIGVVRDLLTSAKETIFESPYTEWLSTWNNTQNIELTTKASYLANGYSYYMDPQTGDFHKSFKQRLGLTTLADPTNRKILIHEIVNDAPRTSIIDRKSGRSIPLDIQTFPEKCTWSRNGLKLFCAVPDALAYGEEYPDTWYQGLETYTDSLWQIDVLTNKADLISDIQTDFGEKIDVEKISTDKNSDYLFFLDKNTEYLWSYRLHDA